MTNSKVIYPKLTVKQIRLLKLLFKFRFLSASLFARITESKTSSIQRTLNLLIRQELACRHYNSSYKIAHRPASYYLSLKGLRYLVHELGFTQQMIHPHYKDRTASTSFIDRSFSLASIYIKLRDIFPNATVFSKAELIALDNIISPPDYLITTSNTKYYMEVFETAPTFAVLKRVYAYLEEEILNADNETSPKLLIVLANASAEKRLQFKLANTADSDCIFTTTINAMIKSDSEIKIWTDVTDSETPLQI